MYDAEAAQQRYMVRAPTRIQGTPAPGGLVWNCGAGRARVCNEGGGLYRAEYSGAVSEACFYTLRAHVVSATLDAKALVLDMSKVLDLHMGVPTAPPGTYRARAAPGVVLCRADHHAMWSAYAVHLAKRGITRVVFYDSEQALALTVARALAQH